MKFATADRPCTDQHGYEARDVTTLPAVPFLWMTAAIIDNNRDSLGYGLGMWPWTTTAAIVMFFTHISVHPTLGICLFVPSHLISGHAHA
jgi:hypothetical protein